MKQFIFLLLSVLFGDSFFAQEWAPVGSKWIYSNYDDYSLIIVHESVKDTLIENKNYRKVISYKITDGVTSPIEDMNYLYLENNKVYFYKWGTNNLVFDFSLNINDSYIANDPSDQNNSGTLELEFIYDHEMNGNIYNHYYYQANDNLFFGDGVIDQIGGYKEFFPSSQLAFPTTHPFLMCYATGDSLYYYRYEEFCDSIRTLKLTELELNGLQFSPNPLSELSTLEIPAELGAIRDISVYGLNGQESSAYEWKERKISLRASDFVPGVYFIRVETEKQRLFGKFAAE